VDKHFAGNPTGYATPIRAIFTLLSRLIFFHPDINDFPD